MPSLLIKNAAVLAAMDDAGTEIVDGGMYVVDGFIEQVGPSADLPAAADEVLDLRGHVVIPGLINTHHHLYQTLTRALPGAQDAGLFDGVGNLAITVHHDALIDVVGADGLPTEPRREGKHPDIQGEDHTQEN